MKALVYVGNEVGAALAQGCARHGVAAGLRRSDALPESCDVVFIYGVASRLFSAYEGRALRVVVDLGYWRERVSELPVQQRHVRVAVESVQPDWHLRLHRHSPDRFERTQAFHVKPLEARGDAVLVCGHSPQVAAMYGKDYGEWETRAVKAVANVSLRPIRVRAAPTCLPLPILNVTHCCARSIGEALREAFAVVCMTGNVGADAILYGVPVYCEAGPGAVYGALPLDWIDDALPLPERTRAQALADLAYWQWTPAEIAAGELWAHLQREGLLQ